MRQRNDQQHNDQSSHVLHDTAFVRESLGRASSKKSTCPDLFSLSVQVPNHGVSTRNPWGLGSTEDILVKNMTTPKRNYIGSSQLLIKNSFLKGTPISLDLTYIINQGVPTIDPLKNRAIKGTSRKVKESPIL